MDNYPYKVYDRNGKPLLQAAECRRPPKDEELSLLDAGCTIKLHGKKITKKEVQNRVCASSAKPCKPTGR